MKKTILTGIFAFTLLYTGISAASNDYDKEPAKWWANVTAGRGGSAHQIKSTGISSVLSFNGTFKDNIFGTYYMHASTPAYHDEYVDKGFMVGYKKDTDFGYYSFSSGIGFSVQNYRKTISGTRFYQEQEYKGVVLPVQAQLFWTPFKHVGFGVTTHAAIGKTTYGSVNFGFQFYG